jgi:hypothetical protein
MAKIIRPTMIGASNFIRNTIIAIITINTITPTIIEPIVPTVPKTFSYRIARHGYKTFHIKYI